MACIRCCRRSGRAHGADAADAGRDGSRLRRDADLPGSCSRTTKDPKKRKAMLAAKVEDMLNTVVRQIAFYTFERKIHTARKEGELTAEQISALWLEVQGESLGPASPSRTGYETFWVYISHFIHSPFYVYAYAFGDCLVNSLYARYRESAEGLPGEIFRHAEGRRQQASQRAVEALRPRCQRSRPSGRRASRSSKASSTSSRRWRCRAWADLVRVAWPTTRTA